jgi:hypothetical protein
MIIINSAGCALWIAERVDEFSTVQQQLPHIANNLWLLGFRTAKKPFRNNRALSAKQNPGSCSALDEVVAEPEAHVDSSIGTSKWCAAVYLT